MKRSGSHACSSICCPDQPEVGGLLALMLLTDARRPARIGPDGELIPLDEQVRSRWNQERSRKASGSSSERSRGARRAVPGSGGDRRAARRSPEHGGTDWPQILALYDAGDRG